MYHENSSSRRKQALSRRIDLRPITLTILCVIAMLMIASCAGDSEQSTVSDTEGDGKVIIGLTDDPGDFISYTVDVVSLTLTKATGVVVQTLPLKTRVDFAQYTEMTEFLTAATITPGIYTRATLELRFRQNGALTADIQVEDSSGDAVMIENIMDENGNAVETIDVSVELENQNALWIRPGIPAHLTLDFDLDASNTVTFDEQGTPELIVQPVLLAEVNPTAPKIHRLRGPLKAVDPAAGTFDVIIRPFYHPLSDKRVHFGIQTVVVDENTIFDINGEQFIGYAGMFALAAQPDLTAVVALGDLDLQSGDFNAAEVSAGSSVPGGAMDVAEGNVIRREGDEILIKGAILIRGNGSVVFNDTVTVRLGVETRVRQQLSAGTFGIGDISVGQRITVFGELSGDENVLVADQGAVYMHLTTLKGTVVANDAPLVMDLATIDHRSVDGFDFSGTGVAPAVDADPHAYAVGTGDLDISGYGSGTPLRIRGFVTPFSHAADENDFEARTIIDISQAKGVLHADWFPASTQAIESVSAEGFSLNLADENLGLFHHLFRRGEVTDLTQLSMGISILPDLEAEPERIGIFSIVHHQVQQTFFSFDNFTEELSERLNEGASIRWVKASGRFDDAAGILTANWVKIKIKPIPFHAAETSAGLAQP